MLPAREDTEVRRDAARSFLRAAGAAGDDASQRARWLRAWATLVPESAELPVTLEAEAAAARAWASQRGSLRLYASRLRDRVRAGVGDPAGIVDHLAAYTRDASGQHLLARVESEQLDRWEYDLGAERSAKVVVVIEAVTRLLDGADVVVARVVLEPTDEAPPPAPDPAKLTGLLPERAPATEPAEEPLLAWWWIAGAAVAAALAGAAVWQELRD